MILIQLLNNAPELRMIRLKIKLIYTYIYLSTSHSPSPLSPLRLSCLYILAAGDRRESFSHPQTGGGEDEKLDLLRLCGCLGVVVLPPAGVDALTHCAAADPEHGVPERFELPSLWPECRRGPGAMEPMVNKEPIN